MSTRDAERHRTGENEAAERDMRERKRSAVKMRQREEDLHVHFNEHYKTRETESGEQNT